MLERWGSRKEGNKRVSRGNDEISHRRRNDDTSSSPIVIVAMDYRYKKLCTYLQGSRNCLYIGLRYDDVDNIVAYLADFPPFLK